MEIFDIKLKWTRGGAYDWIVDFDQEQIKTPEQRKLFIHTVKQFQHSIPGTAVMMLKDADCIKLAEECGFTFQQKAWGGLSIYAYK